MEIGASRLLALQRITSDLDLRGIRVVEDRNDRCKRVMLFGKFDCVHGFLGMVFNGLITSGANRGFADDGLVLMRNLIDYADWVEKSMRTFLGDGFRTASESEVRAYYEKVLPVEAWSLLCLMFPLKTQ